MTGSLRVEISELSKLAGLLDTTHDQLLASAGAQAAGAQVGNTKVAEALNEFYTNWDYRRRGLAERLGVLGTLLFKAADIYAENERMLKQGFAPQAGEGDARNDPQAVSPKDNKTWKGATVKKADSYDALLPKAAPKPADVAQGQVGDCYFAAAVAAIAATPSGSVLLQSMIKLRDDNKFEVTFADGRVEVVDGDLFVDADHHLVGGGEGDPDQRTANWYSILEKAEAQRHGNSYGDLNKGGNARDVFAELIPPGRTLDPLDVGPKTNASDVWDRLHDAIVEGRPACVAITSKTLPDVLPIVDGKIEGHELSVLGTYEKDGIRYVQLRNPWGTLYAKAGGKLSMHDGLVNAGAQIPGRGGYAGTFDIPVDKLSKIISQVETGTGVGDTGGASELTY